MEPSPCCFIADELGKIQLSAHPQCHLQNGNSNLDLPGIPGRRMQCDGQCPVKSVQLKHRLNEALKQGVLMAPWPSGQTVPTPSRPHLLAPHFKPPTSQPPSLSSLVSLSSSPPSPPRLVCIIHSFLYASHASNSGLSILKCTCSHLPHSKTKLNCQLLQKV